MENGGRPSFGQVILLTTSSAITALFYSIYRQKYRSVQTLKEAKKISLSDDLQRILMDLPGKCVPYAVIEGVVTSVKDVLNSQYVENCKGVIQRLSLKEHKMVWNRTTHLWNDHEKIIHQRTNAVPFDLTLMTLRKLESVQSFTDVLGHYMIGERPKGVQETEEKLKIGATITAWISRDWWRKQRVRCVMAVPDYRVRPCHVRYRLLYTKRQYRHHKEKRRLGNSRGSFRKQEGRQEEETEGLRNPCVICLSSEKSCVFLECGHVCSCFDCYQALHSQKMSCVGDDIARVVPLYNS
ncbi:hypothetical protein GDO86_019429 [Hymenochirus boettgeri]|uniref:RING-type E3 ubiquitin transferase n=1 Tax=Hymenochirus boettgeri TaxID=247094 RepID=A0A8T2IJ30_9PIPI|nr:hypothetical protein GDO86_019429 [Hymenochirus boettgeri]